MVGDELRRASISIDFAYSLAVSQWALIVSHISTWHLSTHPRKGREFRKQLDRLGAGEVVGDEGEEERRAGYP